MDDLLGSPRVGPLFPFSGRNFFHIYIYRIYLIYVHIYRLGIVQRLGRDSNWGPGLGSW